MRITASDPRVLVMPSRYVQGNGVIALLGGELARLCKRPLLIVDEFILSTYGEALEADLKANQLEFAVVGFSGLCTQEKSNGYAQKCRENGYDLVAGIGGGSAIDAAKGAAVLGNDLGLKVVSIPTVASNDAPTSRACVFYTPGGSLEKVALLPENPCLVLVDTGIVAKAPVMFLISGIGDALTTKFEAEQCAGSGHRSRVDARQTMTGMAIGDLCYRTLREYARQAIWSVENGIVTEALEYVVEATILLSGAGFENGGLAAAHAMTRGLSTVPQLHSCLHGYEVAYGLMVQFILEGRQDDFIMDMMRFYRDVGLPTCLADLGLQEVTGEILDMIVGATCRAQDSHIHKMVLPVDEAKLSGAILLVESLSQKC